MVFLIRTMSQIPRFFSDGFPYQNFPSKMTSTRSQRLSLIQGFCNMLVGVYSLFDQQKHQKLQDWQKCTVGSDQSNFDEFS